MTYNVYNKYEFWSPPSASISSCVDRDLQKKQENFGVTNPVEELSLPF